MESTSSAPIAPPKDAQFVTVYGFPSTLPPPQRSTRSQLHTCALVSRVCFIFPPSRIRINLPLTNHSASGPSSTWVMSYSGNAVAAAPRRRQTITWLRSCREISRRGQIPRTTGGAGPGPPGSNYETGGRRRRARAHKNNNNLTLSKPGADLNRTRPVSFDSHRCTPVRPNLARVLSPHSRRWL